MNRIKQLTKLVALIICPLLMLAGCGEKDEPVSATFQAMDTFMNIKIYGSEDSAKAVRKQIENLDLKLSPTIRRGDILRVNRRGKSTVDEATAEVVKQSLELCRETDGALDITVYPLTKAWGFINGRYSVPDQSELDELLKTVDYRNVSVNGAEISIKNKSQLDLGAVAKGFAADKAAALLKEQNVSSALLNLGGTVAAVGSKPDGSDWKIGVADPLKASDYVGYLYCKDKYVATSGNYERYFEKDGKRYSHLLDPKTGKPAENRLNSVTVICDSGIKSDCLSTALYVMGPDKAKEYQKKHKYFEFVMLTADKKALVSSGIKDSFKLTDKSYEIEVTE